MSLVNFTELSNEQELIALAMVIICPACGTRVLAMGPALNDTSCPKCDRVYSSNTRKIMRECLERNTLHKG